MKKATAFALAAALTIGLSGCGNSNTTETEAETVTEAATEAPETEADTAEETEEVTEAVTEAETETESETEEVTEAETETESETEEVTEAETEPETEEVTEAETESETEEVTEAVTEVETESETEEATEAETETEEATEAETETEEVTEAETETETETETEEVTEAETESETEEVTEAETETETESETEEVTETETETESETEEVTEAVTEAETETETESETEAVTETESEEAKPEVMTYEEYIAADVDTLVVVETYVQAKQSWWDDTATVYTQDEDGAYFLYNMECSEEDYELLEVGTKIQVTGYKSEWSGEVEIIDATFEIIDDGDTFIAETLDVTELLGTDELEEHQNEYVSFTGMTVEASEDPDGNEVAFLYAWDGSGSEGDDLYFNVSYNGEIYNFVIESYLCDSTTEVYQAVTELSVGDVIDMEGFLYWYEGVNPHITSVVVTEAAATEEETEAETETEEVTEAVTEEETEEPTEVETETEEVTEAVTEAETEEETEELTEAETETEEVTEAVTEAETEEETEELTEAETETEEVTEAVTEAETEEETEEPTEAETETEEVTEAVTEAETEEETEEPTEAETETEEVTEAESEGVEAEVMTYEEYIAADVDTLVVVETYVQAKQSWWEDTATVYTQDEDGAYFLYNMECSEEDYELLEVGTKIQVTGYKSEWSGEVEIIDATFEIIDDGDTFIAEPLDVTELLGTDELEEHQNEYVSFTGMTVEASEDPDGNEVAFLYAWDGSGEEGDDLYFNVSYNGETYTFVVESYLCDSTTDVYQAVTELEVGDVIDMEGFLYWYEGVNPHITSVAESLAEEVESESETE